MGNRRTQVARDAVNIVLQDDALASIIAAVREGQVIFANIQKFVLYFLSCNPSEVMVIGIAFMLNRPLPLLPLHILFLRPDAAVTASFLTLALAQLWHVFHMRDRGSSISRNDITTNRYVWHALCLCVALLLAAVCLRRISIVLKLSNPSKIVWLITSGLSLMPVVFRILLGDRQEQKAELS